MGKRPPDMKPDCLPEDLKVVFGENVRTARMRKGLTQGQLAAQVGTTGQYISKIENGHKDVTLSTVAQLADALETTPGHLLRRPVRPG